MTARSTIPFILTSGLLALAATLAGVLLVGPNLGGVFAAIAAVAILLPLIASTDLGDRVAFAASTAGAIGVTFGTSVLLLREAIDGRQFLYALVVLLTMSLAVSGATRLLIAAGVNAAIASTLVTLATLAWLSWPIWLSPWLTENMAAVLVPVHPLFGTNSVIPQYGYFLQNQLTYDLTTLGQDVPFALPDGVGRCGFFQAILGTVAWGSVLGVRTLRPPRNPPSGGQTL